MAGYFGSEEQQRLQARAEENSDFISSTAGACQTGRTMGCDDPDRLGWSQIAAFLEQDKICGFRLIPTHKAPQLRSHLARLGYRFDTWDVFLADRTTGLAASRAILAEGLPDNLIEMEIPSDPEGPQIKQLQILMAEAGVVPFSCSMLAGAFGPVTTVAIGNSEGTVVAAAHGYMPHNSFSAFRDYAWGGLVAVAKHLRGKRIGNQVNARMVFNALTRLGATHIYELVSTTNTASRRMVEGCGLRHDPTLVCGLAVPQEGPRFTR